MQQFPPSLLDSIRYKLEHKTGNKITISSQKQYKQMFFTVQLLLYGIVFSMLPGIPEGVSQPNANICSPIRAEYINFHTNPKNAIL
jgi:hypothetical protein